MSTMVYGSSYRTDFSGPTQSTSPFGLAKVKYEPETTDIGSSVPAYNTTLASDLRSSQWLDLPPNACSSQNYDLKYGSGSMLSPHPQTMYPYLHPPFDNRSRLPPSPSSSSSPPSPSPSTSYPDIAQGASRPGHMDYHTPALSPIYEGHYPSQTAHSHNTHRRTGSDPLMLPLAYGHPYPDVHRRSGPRTSTARCEWEGCDITLDDLSHPGIRRHFRAYHPVSRGQMVRCTWGGPCRSEPMLFENIPKHIAECHLKSMAQECPDCHNIFARKDTLKRHQNAGCSAVARAQANAHMQKCAFPEASH